MQPKNISFVSQDTQTTSRSISPTSLTSWGINLLSRATIRQKIGCGYALAIGIAILGTTAGVVIGDYSQNQAQKQLALAIKKEQLLHEVQRNVLHMRLHQHEIIILVDKPNLFHTKHDHFLTHIKKVREILPELKTLEQTGDLEALKPFLQTALSITEPYNLQMEKLLDETRPSPEERLGAEEITTRQQKLLNFTTTELTQKFDTLLNDLVELIKQAQTSQVETENSLNNAKDWRTRIIIFSLLLSMAIASLLALYTSRLIAKPIESVTKVAQRVTEENNFELQAPVTTSDEVGVLATAFNNLIQRVAVYTRALELARQTLEERVEERTEELSQKNEQLESAHENLQQLNTELVSQAQELSAALQSLQETQTQLIQSEKMSSLGQMVAGVAHEINNPINFIYGNITHLNNSLQDLLDLIALYQQHYPNPAVDVAETIEAIDLEFITEDLPKSLSSIQMGANRIRQIVLSLRNFSRLDEADLKAADLHEGIDNTLLILNHRLQPGLEIVKKYGDLPPVMCYPAQLNQVFMNIINNAIDALEGFAEQPNKQIVIQTQVVQGEKIEVKIKDNGPGMPAEVKKKIFDPFFTTKAVGQGTGLGLSISYQIVEKHKGTMEVFSEPGQGTEFAIALPLQDVKASVPVLSTKA